MVLGTKKLGHLISKFERGGAKKNEDEESGTMRRPRKILSPRSKRKLKDVEDVEIGDKISLRDSPWKDAEGRFPCKIMRRPVFAESALVSFAGAAGARAVAQSTKQHLMIVDRHVVEYTKLNETHGRIAFVSSVDEICKMRVRHEEQLVAIFFKPGKDDPLILNCCESSLVSQEIRAARGSNLVKKEAINKALHLIQEIQAQERALEYQPSLQRVNEIVSLYEKATQQFVIAGDPRHEEVEEHKMKFLKLPKVASIRKGVSPQSTVEPKREPEILESSMDYLADDMIHQIDSDHDDASQNWADFGNMESQEVPEASRRNDEATRESVDNMIFEARQDFDAFNLGKQLDLEVGREGVTSDGESSAFAEFEAMMDAAERELDEIRKM